MTHPQPLLLLDRPALTDQLTTLLLSTRTPAQAVAVALNRLTVDQLRRLLRDLL